MRSFSENEELIWNLDTIFSGYEDSSYLESEKRVGLLLEEVASAIGTLQAQELSKELSLNCLQNFEEIQVLLTSLLKFVSARLTIESSAKDSLAERARLRNHLAQLESLQKEFAVIFLERFRSSMEDLLLDARFQTYKTFLEKSMRLAPFSLSAQEERVLAALKKAGFFSWADLYDQLSSKIQVHIPDGDKAVSYTPAQALTLMRYSDGSVRKQAWEGLSQAWSKNATAAAAILNGLADWRFTNAKLRSKRKDLHYLEESLAENRMTLKSLEAHMEALKQMRPELQDLAKSISKGLGRENLEPWDHLAPFPSPKGQFFKLSEALELISEVFRGAGGEWKTFFDLSLKKEWIETRIMPGKSSGAYCTYFPLRKEPRIFMSYGGSFLDVLTLAHELGHGFHSWVMRDLPMSESTYSSSLAETASTFAEHLMLGYFLKNSRSHDERKEMLWGELQRVQQFLLNIPFRYSFECEFYERKSKGDYVGEEELVQICEGAWREWYGGSSPRPDSYFWAHKLHFSMAQSFYNYPYTVGFLLSSQLFQKFNDDGRGVHPGFVEFLRDTGKLNLKDILRKHLNVDAERADFWLECIRGTLRNKEEFVRLITSR